jgi:hypothetical protein
MYSDKRTGGRAWILWLAALLLAAALLTGFFLSRNPEADLEDGSSQAIRSAIQRSALQCYAVEGVYPPDLDYLQDNYGLQVNREDYYISYDAFASNLPPTVRVTRKAD